MITNSAPSKRPAGMVGLTIVLAGQVISILASTMTSFSFSIWIFERTSSATVLGIMTTAFTVPYLIFIPIAGVLVDRYDRKLMMMISDLAAGLGTVAILVLYSMNALEVWHFYIVNVIVGLGSAFQWPAYSAAISTMVPKAQYGRANGMMSVVQSAPGIVGPMLAGAMLPLIGMKGIMLIDVVTFVVAIGALMMVFVPPPVRTKEGEESKGNLFKEASAGFAYIFKRPSLVGFVFMLLLANFFMGFANAVFVPLVLSRTQTNSMVLGTIETVASISLVVGSLVMGAWGGFKDRIQGVIWGWASYCLFGCILVGFGYDLRVWIPAMLFAGLGPSIGNAHSQALLQAKVAPDLQGRVFSARRLLTWAPDAITPVIGGLLADRIMEPAMLEGGWLSNAFGWMVGNTTGSGMAFISILSGALTMMMLIGGLFFPAIRKIETLLPDHDQMERADGTLPTQEAIVES
jgi:MFS family permease